MEEKRLTRSRFEAGGRLVARLEGPRGPFGGTSWPVWGWLVTRLEGPRGPFGVGLVARLEEEVDS